MWLPMLPKKEAVIRILFAQISNTSTLQRCSHVSFDSRQYMAEAYVYWWWWCNHGISQCCFSFWLWCWNLTELKMIGARTQFHLTLTPVDNSANIVQNTNIYIWIVGRIINSKSLMCTVFLVNCLLWWWQPRLFHKATQSAFLFCTCTK